MTKSIYNHFVIFAVKEIEPKSEVMKKPFGMLFLFILALMSSCENEDVTLLSLEESNIEGCWTHAYEEGSGTYRPCDSQTFAPSRFRQLFNFKPKGEVDYLVLASNDAHYTEAGFWTYDQVSKEISILDDSEHILLSFIITEASEDRLLIEFTSANSFIGG
ncbi:hypothetical protein [Roseivirga misakiensis]|uniref:Lipocalin-like domain-containing protein n=1 Tax=Roseivirga misakiensis TaxID=1563681 RepID=A0A1E5SYN2_9BACT|nr:hypothetical protein [Roseivirga misakiensis]OEK04147.1 hypothetical protein BFP71_11715 [Roseivirga misakiensis]